MSERSQRQSSINQSLRILNNLHKDTLKALAESERRELEFELEMAEVIWQKVKGIPIPESYSIADRLHILERYWHRAMEKE